MREAFDLAHAWSDPEIVPVIELISRRTGLAFPAARMASVEQALQRVRLDAGVAEWESFRRLLITDAKVFDAVAGALTVNESYFFRDPAQFDFLRAVLLPRLAAEPGPIRFWSAGCAAGQEPYTLAIVCDQLGIGDRARIVGFDIARRRVAVARRGRFGRWSLRGASPEIVDRYFKPVDVRFEIVPAIRDRVEFRQMNLADPAAWASLPVPVDVLFCRNVLIYFDQAAIERIARHLIGALSPRGRLFLGASDPPISDYVDCQVEITPAGLIYRKPGARPMDLPGRAPAPRAAPLAVSSESVAPLPVARATDVEVAPPPRVSQPADVPAEASTPTPAEIRERADAGEVDAALAACVDALRARPTSVELSYLHSLLLSQAGRHGEAAAAARRALYLDRSLVLGHVALGIAMAQLGDRAGAIRSLTTARELLASVADGEALPAGGGETASRVRASLSAYLELLDAQ